MGAASLKATDKAAVLLLALGEDIAAQILAQLSPAEVQRLVASLTKLGRIDETTAIGVLEEFRNLMLQQNLTQLSGGSAATRRLIEAAERARGQDLGIKLDDESEQLREVLQNIDRPSLARYLEQEHPQTIALVLAHLDGPGAAEVLKSLPEALRLPLIQRIANLDAVAPELIAELTTTLQTELDPRKTKTKINLGGANAVAQMMASLDKSDADRFLAELKARDPSLGAEIESLLFTFADLHLVDDAGIRLLIAEIPRKTLLLAMKEAPTKVRDKILSNVSERARKTLLDDIEAQGKVRRSDVEAAQRELANRARQLEDAGKLIILRGDSQYV